MKKIFFLAAMFAAFSIASFAQAKPTDFSGTWNLDIPKSQLDVRVRLEALTMTVAQTDKELKVTTETKRPAPPADAAAQPGPNGPGGGRGMRGFGGGDGTVSYSLEGKETVVEADGPNGKMPIKYKATLEAGKVNLSTTRSFNGPMGDITATTKDTWTLSADGKTLTDVRVQSSPRGESTSTLVFVKK
ncbi:MAG TPA: hypothetical protein VMZ26_05455 [Pyrinomonadaceae bacterium]|nr:hypothetical protein [Pyrinomonadaceae bacterium]